MVYTWVSVCPPFHGLIVYSLPLSPSHSFLSCCCLAANSLSGTIPTSMGALLGLNDLYLGEFLSSFPRAYGLLSLSLSPSHAFLSCCCLDSNPLSGTVPTELGALTKLTRLELRKLWIALYRLSMNANNPVLTHARIVCFEQTRPVWRVIWISCALLILNGCTLLPIIALKRKMEVFWPLVLAVLINVIIRNCWWDQCATKKGRKQNCF
jgi:hypothetical protein